MYKRRLFDIQNIHMKAWCTKHVHTMFHSMPIQQRTSQRTKDVHGTFKTWLYNKAVCEVQMMYFRRPWHPFKHILRSSKTFKNMFYNRRFLIKYKRHLWDIQKTSFVQLPQFYWWVCNDANKIITFKRHLWDIQKTSFV